MRKKKNPIKNVAPLKPLNYDVKIILAWAEAISGNKEMRDFLTANGYEELGVFCYALLLKDDARDWLKENGYAHLLAMIHGVEGNKTALDWLEANNFKLLRIIALAGDGEPAAYHWLDEHDYPEFKYLAKKIQEVKDEIEEDHNDMHKFGRD